MLLRYIHSVPDTVWWAILIGLFIHIFGLTIALDNVGVQGLVRGDAVGYMDLAHNLADGKGYVQTVDGGYEFETFRTPGLPWVLSLFVSMGVGLVGFLYCMTIVSAIVLPLTTWYIARVLFTARTAVASAWLITLEPFMWIFSWYPYTEMLFLVVSLVAVAFCIRALVYGVWSYAVLAGLLMGASLLVRPAALLLYAVLFVGLGVHALVTRQIITFSLVAVMGALMVTVLVPWVLLMHQHTGVYAVSGTGWRNVYTDYLASVRAIDQGTGFTVQKEALKDFAYEEWGIDRVALNSPVNGPVLRAYAVPEILAQWPIVLRLEPMLMFAYFTNTDYLSRFVALGFMPPVKGQVSVTQVILREGVHGLPIVFRDLKQRYFLPVLERVWALGLFLVAVVGYVCSVGRARHLMVLCILVGAVTSTAIGLGVEARLRLPILPYYYMLVVFGMLYIHGYVQTRWPAIRARFMRSRIQ